MTILDCAVHLEWTLKNRHTRKDAERARRATNTHKKGKAKPKTNMGNLGMKEHALTKAENACGRSMKLRPKIGRKLRNRGRSGKCRNVTIAYLIERISHESI